MKELFRVFFRNKLKNKTSSGYRHDANGRNSFSSAVTCFELPSSNNNCDNAAKFSVEKTIVEDNKSATEGSSPPLMLEMCAAALMSKAVENEVEANKSGAPGKSDQQLEQENLLLATDRSEQDNNKTKPAPAEANNVAKEIMGIASIVQREKVNVTNRVTINNNNKNNSGVQAPKTAIANNVTRNIANITLRKANSTTSSANIKARKGSVQVLITTADGGSEQCKEVLMAGAEENNLDMVRFVINSGSAEVDTRNRFNETPLILAAEHGCLSIVEFLMARGADVDSVDDFGCSALACASRNGHYDTVRFLTEKGKADVNVGDRYGVTPLMWAVQNSHEQIVQFLVKIGAARVNTQDDHGWAALCYASALANASIVNFLLANGADIEVRNQDGSTPLVLACGRLTAREESSKIINLLVQSGAEIGATNFAGNNALMHAAGNGNLAAYRELLRAAAGHQGGLNINNRSCDGSTALIKAAKNGSLAIVRSLIANGADVNLADNEGRTALILAADFGCSDIVQVLLSNGAFPNARGTLNGSTALIAAARTGSIASAKLLINYGANIVDKDDQGDDAITISTLNGHSLLARYLTEQVAKRSPSMGNSSVLKSSQIDGRTLRVEKRQSHH